MVCKPLVYTDESIGLATTLSLIITAIKLCTRTPIALVYSIAIQLLAILVSYFLVNITLLVYYVRRYMNRSPKGNKGTNPQDDNIEGQIHDIEAKPINTDLPVSEIDVSIRQRSFSARQTIRRPSYLGIIDNKYEKYGLSFKADSKSGRVATLFNRIISYIISHGLNSGDGQASKYTWIQFMSGLQVWFRINCLKPMLSSKVWVIASLFTTLSWCILWEWAIQYLHRKEGDFNLLHWVLNDIPVDYWYLDASFQIMFAISYLLNLYGSESRCGYILSLYGLIDMSMTPILTELFYYITEHYELINVNPENNLQHFGPIFFGPLRFFRLLQAEKLISASFSWISDVYTIIISVATVSLALLFSFSGMLFLVEAPILENGFVKPFDFVYFGVATMGTVGYGDYSPVTFYGRAMSIVFIAACITFGAMQLKRLESAVAKKRVTMGSHFDSADKYILFWGPITNYQLVTYCKCISNTYTGVIEKVVVASPLPLEYYEIAHMAITNNTRIKLSIICGNGNFIYPSHISKLVFNSSYTVVVNDMDTSEVPNFSIYQANDDRETILMYVPPHNHNEERGEGVTEGALASLNITRPLNIPLTVQLHGTEYKSLLQDNNVHAFYAKELKYKLFSRSIGCRGLFYLLLMLFYSPTNIRRARIYVEELCNLFLISSKTSDTDDLSKSDGTEFSIAGLQNQMFELIRGMKFQIFKMKFPKCSRGIVSDTTCILNPIDYVIGEEVMIDAAEFNGLVLAETLRDVLKVSSLTKLPMELLLHKSDVKFSHFNSANSNDIVLTEICEVERVIDAPTYRGVYKVPDYQFAIENVFTQQLPTLLICGWTRDLNDFIKVILSMNKTNIIILAPIDAVEDENPIHLNEFPQNVVFMDGSALSIRDLTNAGLNSCSCAIILNCNHVSGKDRIKKLSKDMQILFVRHLIYNTADRIRPPYLILDIHHASCLEYLDPSLIVNVDITQKKDAANKVWENYGEFMCSYELTSGTIFAQDMFYGLLAHSNVNLNNSVNYEYVDSILNGGVIRFKGRSIEGGFITQEPMPMAFHGGNFETLHKYYLHVEHRICIGIMRTYYMPFANYGGIKQLIIVAPQPSFTLQSNDKVYVINKANFI